MAELRGVKFYCIERSKEFGEVSYNTREEFRLSPGVTPHCENGPAYIFADGGMEWWVDGLTHRSDGPAFYYTDSPGRYFLEGVEFEKEDFEEIIQEIREMPFELRLTDPRKWVREFKHD